ncbi:MAG: lysozyme inhibitor LprI family protein [Terracidiphilus sp.]
MRKFSLAAALLLIFTTQLAAQLPGPSSEFQAKCAKYLQTPLPTDVSDIAVPNDFPECDSMALYYGTWETSQNFQAAASCAWQERAFNLSEKGKPTDAPNTPIPFSQIYGGSAILVNIYANGLSVPRSIPLALRFACETDIYEWPGGLDDAIEALENLNGKPVPQSKKDYFKMCDFQGSTPTVAACANWSEEAANEDRNRAIKALTRKWNPSQISAFSQLRIAAEFYYHRHAGTELNNAGTARAVEAIGELDRFRDIFLASLTSFERNNFPKGSANDFTKSDKKLNILYRKTLANAESNKDEYGTPKPEGIHTTQRAWLKYRDAWITFAKLRYPSVSADSWLTLLTNDRIAILNDTACEIGIDDPSCEGRGEEYSARPLP